VPHLICLDMTQSLPSLVVWTLTLIKKILLSSLQDLWLLTHGESALTFQDAL